MKVSSTAERLRDCMDQLRLKQSTLLTLVQPFCESCGTKMNKSDLCVYLQGKVLPSPDKLYALSQALDVDMAWLMGYDVPMRKAVSVVDADSIPGMRMVREDEHALLDAWRVADEVYRQVALELLETHPRKERR